MVALDGKIKISDFGVAQMLDIFSEDDHISSSLGSPAFQPPEVARGEETFSGFKSDIWALGVTLYYMITGDYPFTGRSRYHLLENIAAGKCDIPARIDPLLRDLLCGMLDPDPDRRYSLQVITHHPFLKVDVPSNSWELALPPATPVSYSYSVHSSGSSSGTLSGAFSGTSTAESYVASSAAPTYIPRHRNGILRRNPRSYSVPTLKVVVAASPARSGSLSGDLNDTGARSDTDVFSTSSVEVDGGGTRFLSHTRAGGLRATRESSIRVGWGTRKARKEATSSVIPALAILYDDVHEERNLVLSAGDRQVVMDLFKVNPRVTTVDPNAHNEETMYSLPMAALRIRASSDNGFSSSFSGTERSSEFSTLQSTFTGSADTDYSWLRSSTSRTRPAERVKYLPPEQDDDLIVATAAAHAASAQAEQSSSAQKKGRGCVVS